MERKYEEDPEEKKSLDNISDLQREVDGLKEKISHNAFLQSIRLKTHTSKNFLE